MFFYASDNDGIKTTFVNVLSSAHFLFCRFAVSGVSPIVMEKFPLKGNREIAAEGNSYITAYQSVLKKVSESILYIFGNMHLMAIALEFFN